MINYECCSSCGVKVTISPGSTSGVTEKEEGVFMWEVGFSFLILCLLGGLKLGRLALLRPWMHLHSLMVLEVLDL